MQTIFLSPHFDDVALSCGGLVSEKSRAGEQVTIWTICAGDIPPGPLSSFAQTLHSRWQTGRGAVEQRRMEDIASCNILGARYRHFSVPDCIYRYVEIETLTGGLTIAERHHLYSEETFLGPIHPAEAQLIEQLVGTLQSEITDRVQVISPLAIGGHVDHRLVRSMAEKLGGDLLYYADYPYCLKEKQELKKLELAGWIKMIEKLSEESLQSWQKGIAAHASQISTFWPDVAGMAKAIEDYYEQSGGCILWKAP